MAVSPLHGLGDDEGPATEFEWKWHWSVLPLAPWLLLLPLLMMKSNRNRRAWAVLIPVAVLAVPFYTLQLVPGLGVYLVDGFMFITLGLAVVWLLSHRLRALGRARAFFNSCALFVLVGIGATMLGDGLSFSRGFADSLVSNLLTYLAVGAAVFLAILFAAFVCRKHYDRTRFAVSFLGALVVMSVLVVMALMMFVFLSMLASGQLDVEMLLAFLGAAPVGMAASAGILLVLTTPFLVLTMRNGLYEGRLRACCRFPEDVETTAVDVVEEEPSAVK